MPQANLHVSDYIAGAEMSSFYLFMIIGLACGLVSLFLISGDLARRMGLLTGRRVLLAGALGLGVIAFTIKVVIVSVLLPVAGNLHPEPLPRPDKPTDFTLAFDPESAFTASWQVLPRNEEIDGHALSPQLVELGKRLFNDPNLSSNKTIACSSCHKMSAGGADHQAVSPGISGLRGARNAPTVLNARYLSHLFWDGRAASLEEQAKGPLTNPVEMGMPSEAAVEDVVRENSEYVEAFARIFKTAEPVTIDNIAYAIATYERTLVTPETAYDRFVRGDAGALSPAQLRGMALFSGLGCRICHRDPVFSAAGTIQPSGVYKPFPVFPENDFVTKYDLISDLGARQPKAPSESGQKGLWRVPSLRNVANTAPYFHNGRVNSLEEAVRVMAVSQLRWKLTSKRRDKAPQISWNSDLKKVSPYRPSMLSPDDVEDIAAFLRSISQQ